MSSGDTVGGGDDGPHDRPDDKEALHHAGSGPAGDGIVTEGAGGAGEGGGSVAGGLTAPSDGRSEPVDVHGAVEALLLVTDQPASAGVLARALERPESEVEAALHALAAAYTERGSGIDVRCVAGGWRLYTRAEFSAYVERFLVDGQQARLTQAALETLAVIAYRQPVTRSRVSAVRGVNVDGVVRTLVNRGLVVERGHDETTGGALYVTTELFLERLGVQSLEALPSLAPLLPELAELETDSTSA